MADADSRLGAIVGALRRYFGLSTIDPAYAPSLGWRRKLMGLAVFGIITTLFAVFVDYRIVFVAVLYLLVMEVTPFAMRHFDKGDVPTNPDRHERDE